MDYKKELETRITNRQKHSLIDVNTRLAHFALISYAVPVDKIRHHIPKPFKLWSFNKNGTDYALISAVPFMDKDFSFYRFAKAIKFKFFQTNFRTYIINQETNEYSAWFFGTTLGSITNLVPKIFWQMPWEYGRYKFEYNLENDIYSKYQMSFSSKQGNGIVDIQSDTKKMKLLDGFDTIEQQRFILTHPTKGYYQIGKDIGTYQIWHPEMNLWQGKSKSLYFEIYERLNFLTKEEMQTPHSVLITPEIEFDILLPPGKLKTTY